jgi:tetratricopeptide (TPR) repeat protein
MNDPEIMRLRDKYREASTEKRRMAAEASYADDIPDPFAQLIDPEAQPFIPGNGSVRALAIDPLYAPAILTVGSMEHQLSRKDAAMELFMSLLELPTQTDDLCVIVDKAGEFLLDQEDWPNSARLYGVASEEFPDFAAFHSGLCYCADKMGKLDDAVAHGCRAINVDPSNPMLLSDLYSAAEVSGRW